MLVPSRGPRAASAIGVAFLSPQRGYPRRAASAIRGRSFEPPDVDRVSEFATIVNPGMGPSKQHRQQTAIGPTGGNTGTCEIRLI